MDMENEVLQSRVRDMSSYKTPAGAAKALHADLTAFATDLGYHGLDLPTLMPPDDNRNPSPGYWTVSWESGPYEWGVYLTLWREDFLTNLNWHGEPYYSFDVGFYPN